MNERPQPEKQNPTLNFLLGFLSRHFSMFAKKTENTPDIISINIPESYKTIDVLSYNTIKPYNFKHIGLSCEIVPGGNNLERFVRVKFVNTNPHILSVSLFPNQQDAFAKLLSDINFEIPMLGTSVYEIPLNILDLNQGRLELGVEQLN
jgi:hypothetical protein